ncbi:AAA family ATPase [Marinobacterium litorale]|uniref:AAA family ATPase n=1 Tax=Marinobacterium litorale TaxID=404770 RepID=UPI000566D7E5|nr:AAA family ATPase [Marinobacterium litorale]
MNEPMLYIFSGLPGVGKSTLAKALAKRIGAVYLRVDTVEQAIRDLCDVQVEGEGYSLSYRLASDNLKIGNDVVADSCNPIKLSRMEWVQVAEKSGAYFLNIEMVCSDRSEHRQRVETRAPEVEGLTLPTWEQVKKREYHSWHCSRMVIDTASRSVHECVEQIMEYAR